MKRECCVCHKYLGEKEGPKNMVSHGFCDPCLSIYKAKMMADFEEFDPASHKGYAGQEAHNKRDLSCVAGGEAG